MTRWKRSVLLGVAVALLAGAAVATEASGFVAELVVWGTHGKIDAKHNGIELESRGPASVAVVKVKIEPGGSSGWHHHPGIVLVEVKRGAVDFYDADCDKNTYRAGDGFIETRNKPSLAHNASDTKGAVLYATFIVPSSTPADGLRVDDPQPAGCDVE